jgi:hypothetical protein
MTQLDPYNATLRLLPHQIKLVDAYFTSPEPRVIVLKSEPGFGKSTALASIIERVLKVTPTARVLVIVPAMIREQCSDMLRTAQAPFQVVDRLRFREMLDASVSGVPWPPGAAVIVSREFARLPDIRESLASVQWHLVVADEAHGLVGPESAETLRAVSRSAARVILATSLGLDVPAVTSPSETRVIEWRREQIVDHEGRPIPGAPRPVLREVLFGVSSLETALLDSTFELTRLLSDSPQARFQAASLARTAASSPAALEEALRRFSERAGQWDSPDSSSESLGGDETERQSPTSVESRPSTQALSLVDKAIESIDAVGQDSKLSAFVALLRHLRASGTGAARVCVLTDYLGTVYYLAAEIETLGLECHVVHGGMPTEERHSVLSFRPGVLVATRASLAGGPSLRDITHLVLYDVPQSQSRLTELLSRFDRVGRVTQLNVHVLTRSGSGHRLFELIGD